MIQAGITGISHYLPDKVIDNKFLAEKFKIDEAGIFKKTGILERRYAEDLNTSDLITKAIESLLQATNNSINDIDCIIVGTLTPDFFFPSTAVNVINKIGAKRAWGFDLSAACSGFCYGLHIAKAFIEQQSAKKIIVCGAEKMSATLNNFDYKTGILFGDGAGVVLIEEVAENAGIKSSTCQVVADDLEDVYFRTPFNSTDWSKEKFELDGNKVYRNGVGLTISLIKDYLTTNNIGLQEIDFIVPHQANMRMLREIAKGINTDLNKFLIDIESVGNTGGASIPICMSEAFQQNKIHKGDRLLLCSFGSGYTTSIIDLVWGL